MRSLTEFDECDDVCGEHASTCDGYCTHTDNHQNGCIVHPYTGL